MIFSEINKKKNDNCWMVKTFAPVGASLVDALINVCYACVGTHKGRPYGKYG